VYTKSKGLPIEWTIDPGSGQHWPLGKPEESDLIERLFPQLKTDWQSVEQLFLRQAPYRLPLAWQPRLYELEE
jgi:hypothetical protein